MLDHFNHGVLACLNRRFHMKINTLLTLLAVCTFTAYGALVPFAPPWDDVASGPTDLRSTIARPAGAAGFVVASNGHFYAGPQRLRFFGVNFTAGAGTPDHATADQVAARLAKFGFNAVRLHFLDSTWGNPRLIDYASGDSRNWNTNVLDRLDYFISRLRAEGVYIDLNLLVGREFGHQDGVDARIRVLDGKTAHAVGFFHAPLQMAQQQYARQLLTHRNPYTGITYAEDPAVAIVEINNENGLLHAWLGNELNALPEPFASDLTAQWNLWLSGRYATEAALTSAWHVRTEPPGDELLTQARQGHPATGWRVEQHDTARVESLLTNGTIRIQVRQTGAASWHVQLNHPRINLASNGIYTFTFRARADQERTFAVSAMQAHAPWQSSGLQAEQTIGPQWRDYSLLFVASGETNARIGFTSLNQPNAWFEFDALSLRPGGRAGLPDSESLTGRSIRMPKPNGGCVCSPEERLDWVQFLWETEQRHWREMRRFLREDLHVRAPIVGTIVGCSTPNLMADLDAIDTHAYWQHPQFPGKPWDPANWRIRNISMVDHPEEATLSRLAFAHVAGKPQLVTEYNHPAPNVYASEGPLFLAAYGALQDWDGLFLYTYAHDERGTKAGCIPGFFDIGQHPTDLANIPIASLLFRRADVAPARQCLTLSLPPAQERALIAQRGHAWNVLPLEALQTKLETALRHRIALDLAPASNVEPAPTQMTDANVFTSDTGELRWSLPATNAGVLTLCAPAAKFVIGHVDRQIIDLGHGVSAAIGSTSNHWCTLSLIVLEGSGFDHKPQRILLSATGHAENTGMEWKNADRTTVGRDWGHAPSLVETIPATVHLPCLNNEHPVVYVLNDKGQRVRSIPVRLEHSGIAFDIGPDCATLWFEIVYAALP